MQDFLANIPGRIVRVVAFVGATAICLASVALAADQPAAAGAESGTAEKDALIVCVDPGAMPRTGRVGHSDTAAEGVDVAIARQIGQHLGRPVEFLWTTNTAAWKQLSEGHCDLVMGQPAGADAACCSGNSDAVWTDPYSGSRFGLVVASDNRQVHSLTDLRDKKVGVVAGTAAVSPHEHQIVRFKTRSALLDQFAARQLDAAFLDTDFAAWYLHKQPELNLRVVAEFVPRQHWNMAIAVHGDKTALLSKLNRAVAQLMRSGEIRRAFAAHGVTYRDPFEESDTEVVAGDTWQKVQQRGELIVTMDPANLPYSSARDGKLGFDAELAGLLAKAMGVKLRLEWFDIHRDTSIGQLLDGQCDLAFGSPIDPDAMDDDEALSGKVVYSRPYYGTGYMLVVRRDGPSVAKLADLKGAASTRLGTEAGSVADYRLRQQGYRRRLFRNQLSVLKSLDDRGIDYAYLWANVGWTLHATPEFDLTIVPDYQPIDRWNVAIAMRRGDDELKQHVDAAVDKLVDSGSVAELMAKYHVPHFAPFEDAATPADPATRPGKQGAVETDAEKTATPATSVLGKTSSSQETGSISGRVKRTGEWPAGVDRGPAPQTARRQLSKKRYDGLQRIRSAGTLVVSLDQNNLPFSTAHPQPAGLDYEIAQMLAEHLDLNLKVYWAYSSHDSYPSKLAKRKSCDVALGVARDDRFAERVQFTEPYYRAGYQWVVRSAEGATVPSSDDVGELADQGPIAIEAGLAVRGIEGRPTKTYASLQDVLAAVAKGDCKIGYVISTRGPWLAERHWPGELAFVDASDAVDEIPICAAVRLADTDLRQAIDQALVAMAESGQLREAFARWNMPFRPAEPAAGIKAKGTE